MVMPARLLKPLVAPPEPRLYRKAARGVEQPSICDSERVSVVVVANDMGGDTPTEIYTAGLHDEVYASMKSDEHNFAGLMARDSYDLAALLGRPRQSDGGHFHPETYVCDLHRARQFSFACGTAMIPVSCQY